MKKILLVALSLIFMTACGSSDSSGQDFPSDMTEDGHYEPSYPPANEEPGGYDNDSLSTEQYLAITEHDEIQTDEESIVTLSLKVDTASYSNVERYLLGGSLPPKDAVKIEEMINYFTYDNPVDFEQDAPLAVLTEVGPSPFEEQKYLAMIRVKSKDIPKEDLAPSNLTFLIDTSGSMDAYNKLPLLKESFRLLVDNLTEEDRVSIVTYAGSSLVLLDSVPGSEKDIIVNAIMSLEASGSTAGADGILTAYALAEKNYLPNGNNRIILATDGDFNVGVSSTAELEKLVAQKSKTGIYLSILGFGMGNIRDDIMETLSTHGNGNYAYIHTVAGAKKVLVEELAANLYTVADDVKAQVEFNGANVKSFRLVGYENRMLENRDFADDTKDAGEIGIDTDTVILFELELHASPDAQYKYSANETENTYGDELFEVRIRYKNPGEENSRLLLHPVLADEIAGRKTTDFHFAASVAAFGKILRQSEYGQEISIEEVYAVAADALGLDAKGYRKEFLTMLDEYRRLTTQ